MIRENIETTKNSLKFEFIPKFRISDSDHPRDWRTGQLREMTRDQKQPWDCFQIELNGSKIRNFSQIKIHFCKRT